MVGIKHYIVLFVFTLSSCSTTSEGLLIYAGAINQPVIEDLVNGFERETGIKTKVVIGGSGFLLSQMIISKRADIYFPGSSDFMELAVEKKLVYPESVREVCYLVPSINVQKGNPKNIYQLKDLTKKGIKVAIANPEQVCVGLYGVEILENSFDNDQIMLFKNNLVNYLGSCSKVAGAITLKSVDAVLGWRVFEHWNNKIESIPLEEDEIARLGYIPISISKLTTNKDNAERFVNYVVSKEGKQHFEKYHYFSDVSQAHNYVGKEKPIGGSYKLPARWLSK